MAPATKARTENTNTCAMKNIANFVALAHMALATKVHLSFISMVAAEISVDFAAQ